MKTTRLPKAIDLFCGCGGISSGLRAAGFEIVAGADIEPNYICTFQHNFPNAMVITEDLSALGPSALMKLTGLESGELDILAGGPPCQGFSKNVPRKNRSLVDPNNMLVRTFIDFAVALKPKMVLMENVAEMKNGFDQAYTEEILGRLTSAGFAVSYMVLNAADYGVPQRRKRAFFVAYRGKTAPDFPSPTHIKPLKQPDLLTLPHLHLGHVQVWEAIGDLPSVTHDDTRRSFPYRCPPFTEYQRHARGDMVSVTNHTPRKLAPTQFERLASLEPGEGIKQLPDHLRPKSGYSGAYGRLTRNMIAPTITRWVFHPGSGRFGHPEDIRVITIREAARLQGFSDDFEFTGTYTQQAGQIGNAVPPLLVTRIAESMLRQLGYSARGNGLSDAASKSTNCESDSLSSIKGKRKLIS